MKGIFTALIAVFFFSSIGYSQYKLKDIPYSLDSINKRDDKGKQGVWFFYDQYNTVNAMQHFIDDTLNGYFELYWYTTGKKSDKGFYKNGKLDSTFVGYWENGQKRGEANYVNGLLNGIVISFNEEGKTTSQLKYINGKVDSSYEESFVDSSIVWDNEARNKIDTVKTSYASDWNKKYAVYVNDTLSKEISFFKDIITIENFFDKAVLTKRIVYSKTKPYRIEKVFYYNNGELSKTEFYNKKGELVLEK
jgi:antitoxin component YwqK of YwqJK toxin-antitoxin module